MVKDKNTRKLRKGNPPVTETALDDIASSGEQRRALNRWLAERGFPPVPKKASKTEAYNHVQRCFEPDAAPVNSILAGKRIRMLMRGIMLGECRREIERLKQENEALAFLVEELKKRVPSHV